MVLAGLTATAQTRVDLRTQARDVDFSGASSTKPMKTGADLPSQCTAGEMFFKTGGSPAGANLYGCTTANQWSLQGGAVTVESDGVAVGSRAATNYMTGPGLLSVIGDTGSAINILWALDTAVFQTQEGEQGGSALFCASNSASATDYRCSLSPALGEYTPGMTLHWQPNVTGSGGPTTLNVDTLGAKRVTLFDGASDPTPADIIVGRTCDVRYDGQVFRLMPATARAVGAIADTGAAGIVYRAGGGGATPATADQMSGPFFCQDAGGSGAYACNLTPVIAAYTPGTIYWFKANTANTGPASISFNSLGAEAIKKPSGQDLAANDIRAGQWVMLTYDGVNMEMLSQTAGSGGNISSVFGRTGAVTAAAGDYTTAQVSESGNLYFTNARAQSALSGLYQAPITGAPGTWPSFGNAALLNVGTSTGTVAAGNDSRFPASVTGIRKSAGSGSTDTAAAAADVGALVGIANPSDTNVVNYIGTDGTQHRIAQSGGMVYPGSGIPTSTGSAWGTSYSLVTSVGSPGLDTNVPSEKAVRSALPTCSPGTWNNGACEVKTTIPYTNSIFVPASTTADLTLLTIPASSFITGVEIKHSTQFTSATVTGLTVSVGRASAGQYTDYSPTFEVLSQAVASTTFWADGGMFIKDTVSHVVNAHFIGLSNLGTGSATNLTAGSVTIWVRYITTL